MIRINKYTTDQKNIWDSFVKSSKNNTFLFQRDFMEYHKHKFNDYSLMLYDQKEELIALLPANIENDNVYSHQGLTYGGLILKTDVKLQTVINIFFYLLKFLYEQKIYNLFYKKLPNFYNLYNSEEDEYIFYKLKANNYRVDTSITVDYKNILPFQKRRIREIKKASKNKLNLKFNDNFSEFWSKILTPNLLKRFDKKPVHSLDEIKKLKALFHDEISQVNVYNENNKIIAGTTLFIVNKVVHAQYISTNEEGKKLGAIDYLFNELIHYYSNTYNYFDFGICNENNGKYINKGLLDWKEGFGARTHIHKFFKIDTSKYNLLK